MKAAIASDHWLAWLVETVSLATAAGRSRRYSDANPKVTSLVRLFQPLPWLNVPPATLNPSVVITRSLACEVAATVETVAVVVEAPTSVMPT